MIEDRSVLTRAAPAADRIVTYGRDPDQLAEVRFGAEGAASRPLLAFVHGGFWRPELDRSHAAATTAALAGAGWTVATLEYRRAPGQPELSVQDVLTAAEHLPPQVERHDRGLILVGHSAGGHLVLCAAAARVTDLAGVLGLAPVADLELAVKLNLGNGAAERYLGARASRPDLDPCRLGPPAVATTLVHGAEDAIVPIAVAESYARAQPRARLVRAGGAGHFAVIDPLAPVWATVLAELERLATSQSPRP